MNVLQKPIQMAIIGAAHGVRGEVRVKSFTGDPSALGSYGPLYDAKGNSYQIAGLRLQKDVLVVRFEGVDDRNEAETLNGTALYIDRAALPHDLEDDEFYHADLIGLNAVAEDGSSIGKVVAVQNFGGGDILVLRSLEGDELFVPFTRAAVPEVAIQAGFVRVDRQAAGFLEEGVPAEADGAAGSVDRSGEKHE